MTGPSGLAELEDLARAFARGEKTPTEPRHASTVILLRDAEDGPEAYLLRRVKGMAFAAILVWIMTAAAGRWLAFA